MAGPGRVADSAVVVRLRGLTGRLEDSFVLRCLRRYLAIRGTDRALVIAGHCFTALIPLLIVAATIMSSQDGVAIADWIIIRCGLTGESADAVRQLFARPPGAQSVITAGSVLLLVFSGLSLARSLQRTYELAWELPPRGVRGTLAGLTSLAMLLTLVGVIAMVGSISRNATGPYVTFLVCAPISVLLWWPLLSVLLGGRVRPRKLLPGAIVAGVGQQFASSASGVWMPHTIATNTDRYGIIGVVFALLTWLLMIALVLVVAAVVSAELGRPTLGAPSAPARSAPAAR